MAEGTDGRYRHFVLEDITETEGYRSSWSGGRRSPIPEQNRAQHGGALQRQINAIRPEVDAAQETQRTAGIEEKGLGLQIEFESFPDIELAFESLARERSGNRTAERSSWG